MRNSKVTPIEVRKISLEEHWNLLNHYQKNGINNMLAQRWNEDIQKENILK